MFATSIETLLSELENSDVFSKECGLASAWLSIENFLQRLEPLESEAQDLIELQALLESNIVNFDILPELVLIFICFLIFSK